MNECVFRPISASTLPYDQHLFKNSNTPLSSVELSKAFWYNPVPVKRPPKTNNKLRVFEAFAGIGAQASALDRLGINYEIVGTSEWFVNALECYAAIHCAGAPEPHVPNERKELLAYLSHFTFSNDSVTPASITKAPIAKLKKLYRLNKLCRNYGSITQIRPEDLPDIDLLVYSFPCQDLSTGGLGRGMGKGSGTRSGLLWEIERILTGLKSENRLPEYLLLENVPAIKAQSFQKDLGLWLAFLESVGYKNDDLILLNALDFGVPQDRTRAFIVSHLETRLDVGKNIEALKRPREFRIHDFLKTDYSRSPIHRAEADEAQLRNTPSRQVMWKINGRETITNKTVIGTITTNMDRTHTAALFRYSGKMGESFRRPTMREAFLLMGFSEEEYERAKVLGFPYRKLNKLIGNSIVVNVLSAIFEVLFKDKYRRA